MRRFQVDVGTLSAAYPLVEFGMNTKARAHAVKRMLTGSAMFELPRVNILPI